MPTAPPPEETGHTLDCWRGDWKDPDVVPRIKFQLKRGVLKDIPLVQIVFEAYHTKIPGNSKVIGYAKFMPDQMAFLAAEAIATMRSAKMENMSDSLKRFHDALESVTFTAQSTLS